MSAVASGPGRARCRPPAERARSSGVVPWFWCWAVLACVSMSDDPSGATQAVRALEGQAGLGRLGSPGVEVASRIALAVLGAVLSVFGIRAVLETINQAGSAALVAGGVALLAAALLAGKVSAVQVGGVKLDLKAAELELEAAAEEARAARRSSDGPSGTRLVCCERRRERCGTGAAAAGV